MYDLNHWLIFLAAATALNLSPGPDSIYILSNTIAHGKRIGFAATSGIASGAMVHILAAAFGLSAVLATSALAFTLVKWVGAAYLCYLGIQMLLSRSNSLELGNQTPSKTMTPLSAYRQGIMVNILNPKVAIFFTAFLPQFIDIEFGYVTFQFLLLGLIVNLLGVAIELCYVLGADKMTLALRRHPRVGVWLDRLLGSILVALGIRLGLQDRT
ncbi:LysE family translocator [Kiloniella laminariae]|uniref:LysE family translocator n=1 Tax=Kiloniella laminariae TaxID=454162 RepID=A0ABT4LI83_9PROT|nr:LysE family translocator [Kiloniella laminariae]MCZ4280825.1 LysE family translocator [Kiloniella laminariae]